MTDCPGAHRDQPEPGEPVWCHRCAARIRGALTGLDVLTGVAELAADGHGEATDNQRRTSNGHAPSPSPAHDILDEMLTTLRGWREAYWELPRLPHFPEGWPQPMVTGRYATVQTETIGLLNRHLDGILQCPFAAEFGHEILWWHRFLTARAKAGTGRRRGMVPCPRCGEKLLFSTDDGISYWCQNQDPRCGKIVPDFEYAELCHAAAPKHASRQ